MSDEVETVEGEAEAPKVDKRGRFVITPEGERVNRTDYIRTLWTRGDMDRSDITKHIKEECSGEETAQGKMTNDIPYQIVFAATKGLEGGLSEEAKALRAEAKEQAKAEKAAAKKAAKAEAAEGGDDE